MLAAGAIAGCSPGSDAPKVPLGTLAVRDSVAGTMTAAHALIGPAARASLDSGNALYRKKQFADALVHYRHASELAPQHAAPFFGIYMVARATGNSLMADSALADIRLRNGPLQPLAHSHFSHAADAPTRR